MLGLAPCCSPLSVDQGSADGVDAPVCCCLESWLEQGKGCGECLHYNLYFGVKDLEFRQGKGCVSQGWQRGARAARAARAAKGCKGCKRLQGLQRGMGPMASL